MWMPNLGKASYTSVHFIVKGFNHQVEGRWYQYHIDTNKAYLSRIAFMWIIRWIKQEALFQQNTRALVQLPIIKQLCTLIQPPFNPLFAALDDD